MIDKVTSAGTQGEKILYKCKSSLGNSLRIYYIDTKGALYLWRKEGRKEEKRSKGTNGEDSSECLGRVPLSLRQCMIGDLEASSSG